MVLKINPLLEEIELNGKIDSILSFEEIPYVLRNSKLKAEKLQKIIEVEKAVGDSQINYLSKTKMHQKLYAGRYILGLKENSDYQTLVAGGIGFLLGIIANEGFRSYVNRLAQQAVSEIQNYRKS